MSAIRVLLVDDDREYLVLLGQLLNSQSHIEVVGTVFDGVSALDTLARISVDVALVDVHMPGVDGIELARTIATRFPGTRVIMLTAFEVRGSIDKALAEGVRGFLTKDMSPQELAVAIADAHAGKVVFSEEPIQILAADAAERQRRRSQYQNVLTVLEHLGDRKKEVARLLARGLTYREISEAVHLSVSTVRGYVSEILEATACATRGEFAVKAITSGWVE